MDGLLSLLLFGVLFFVIMRYGCGAHTMHSGDGAHRHSGKGPDSQESGKDPVCGMDVPANEGYSLNFRGLTYRFCSRTCLDTFETTPAIFAVPAKVAP